MNIPQKFIYLLDRLTPLFKILETKRADWFENKFDLVNWVKEDDFVLDIGCGVGDVTIKTSQHTSNKVIGIDIEDFRRKGNKSNEKFIFIKADVYNLPFKENSFSKITVFWTLHHLNNPIIALKEIMRVLSFKGEIIILEDIVERQNSFKTSFTKLYDKIINLEFNRHPHSNYSIKEWENIISKNFNIEILETKEYPWFTKYKLLKFGLIRLEKLF